MNIRNCLKRTWRSEISDPCLPRRESRGLAAAQIRFQGDLSNRRVPIKTHTFSTIFKGVIGPFIVWHREKPLSAIPGLRGTCTSMCLAVSRSLRAPNRQSWRFVEPIILNRGFEFLILPDIKKGATSPLCYVWRRERPLSAIPGLRGTCTSMCIGIRSLLTRVRIQNF